MTQKRIVPPPDTQGCPIQDILFKLVLGAIECYTEISGGEQLKNEGFIRDWVAISLHEKYRRFVVIEATKQNLLDLLQRDSLQNLPRSFRVDLLVYKANSKPQEASLEAIVEFKINDEPSKIRNDIVRTNGLLSALRSTCGDMDGYQVLCTLKTADEQIERVAVSVGKIAAEVPGSQILQHEIVKAPDGLYGVFLVSVRGDQVEPP